MTGRDWHTVPMNDGHLVQLGKRVAKARTDRGWSKEQAAREAAKIAGSFSAITWKRIEDGEVVRDAKQGAALHVLGLDADGLPADARPTHGLDPVMAAAVRQAVAEDPAMAAIIRQAVADEVEKRLRDEP